jgi:hypothetical protein
LVSGTDSNEIRDAEMHLQILKAGVTAIIP